MKEVENDYLLVNGVGYAKSSLKASNAEAMQRQSDPYFFKIVRTLTHGVNSLNSVTSVSAIILTTQQLNVLSSYISAANAHTITKQLVDALMDTFLKLKVKLIDYSLNYSSRLLTVDIIKVSELSEFMCKDTKSSVGEYISHRVLAQGITIGQKNQWQKLFTQFLRVMAQVFERADDVKLIKLLTETFVNAEYWQDLINVFLMQLLESVCYEEQETLLSPSELLIREKFKDKANDNVFSLISVMEYYVALLHMLQKVVRKENLNARIPEDSQEQLYWKKSVRKALQRLVCVLKPPESAVPRLISAAPAFSAVTKCALSLLAHYFSFGPRLNNQFSEEWLLFYIRTSYLGFIKAYNKGMRLGSERETAAEFCKCYVMCLLAIARNRSESTSRSFYKLRCVEFLTGEIDFEYNAGISNKKAGSLLNENARETIERKELVKLEDVKKEDFKGKLKLDLNELSKQEESQNIDGWEEKPKLGRSKPNEKEEDKQRQNLGKLSGTLSESVHDGVAGAYSDFSDSDELTETKVQRKSVKEDQELGLPRAKNLADGEAVTVQYEVKLDLGDREGLKDKLKLNLFNLDNPTDNAAGGNEEQKPEEFHIEYDEELKRKIDEIEDSDEELLQEYYSQCKPAKPDIKDKLKLDLSKLNKTEHAESQKNPDDFKDKLKFNFSKLPKPNEEHEQNKKVPKEDIRDKLKLKFNKPEEEKAMSPPDKLHGSSHYETSQQNIDYERAVPQKTITLPSRIGRKRMGRSPMKRLTVKSNKNTRSVKAEGEGELQSRNVAPKFSINIHKSQANAIVGSQGVRNALPGHKLKMISKRHGTTNESKKGLDSVLNYSQMEGVAQSEKEELNRTVIDKPRTIYKIRKDKLFNANAAVGRAKKPLAPPKGILRASK